MRAAVVFVLLAAAGAAQPVAPPVAGVALDSAGGLRRVFGVPGNLIPGPLEQAGVRQADFRGRSGLVKTDRELIVLDAQGRPARRMPAPPGPAVFGFDAAGAAQLCFFPETGAWWEITGEVPAELPVGDPGGTVLALERTPDGARMLIRQDDGLWLKTVSLLSGGVLAHEKLSGAPQVPGPNPRISVLTPAGEQPLGTVFELGAVPAGDSLDTRFRVRNSGTSTITVSALSLAGSGFGLLEAPPLPVMLAPDAHFDLTARLQVSAAGSYSALLKVDSTSVFLLAKGVETLAVYVEEAGRRRLLTSGAVVEFGDVERGTQAARRLWVENQTAHTLSAGLALIGASYRLADPALRSVALEPQESVALDVVFEPRQPGSQQGELRVGERRFPLRGSTVEPPLPRPLLEVDLHGQPPASAQQPVVTVRFDPAPRTSGSGVLRLDFFPAGGAGDDPAIVFAATGGRAIPFSVIEGVSEAQFGTAAAVSFQTGTTAGTIVLRAELGDAGDPYAIEIPPAPVTIHAAQVARNGPALEIELRGYDNTRTLSQAWFTFYQRDGAAIGASRQDVSADFRNYFDASELGGVFVLRAVFPVSGGELISGVEVELLNSQGGTKARAAWAGS